MLPGSPSTPRDSLPPTEGATRNRPLRTLKCSDMVVQIKKKNVYNALFNNKLQKSKDAMVYYTSDEWMNVIHFFNGW